MSTGRRPEPAQRVPEPKFGLDGIDCFDWDQGKYIPCDNSARPVVPLPKPRRTTTTTTERAHPTPPHPHHHHNRSKYGIPILVTLLIILAILIAGGFCYLRRSRKKKSKIRKRPPSKISLELASKDAAGDELIPKYVPGGPSVKTPQVPARTVKAAPKSLTQPLSLSYEIPESHFTVDSASVLGRGNFGIVYRGRLLDGAEVAVKTLLPDVLDPKSIRSMLAEMRVMSELGTHPHIVRLMGVNTTNVDSGVVYIFTEICELGGLQAYLRKNKDSFIPNDDEDYVFGQETTHLSKRDLHRWSYQVSSGMMYLADKKIIHGDLATRNILLSSKDQAKIADFGLALKMYNYTGYVRRKEQEQLPWKWMAIETLKYEKFSSESDIWSFAIVLWEIFTLGEVPYPGRRNCTDEFVQEFEQGIRPKKPQHASKEIYKIMLKCWELDPARRPTFHEVRNMLYPFLQMNYVEIAIEPTEDEEGYLMPMPKPPSPVRYV